MEVRITVGDEFRRQFKRLSRRYYSLRDDFDSWVKEIVKNPFVGGR